jgi:hypothetical protein
MREAPRGGGNEKTTKRNAKAQTKKNSGHRRTASKRLTIRDEDEDEQSDMGGVPKGGLGSLEDVLFIRTVGRNAALDQEPAVQGSAGINPRRMEYRGRQSWVSRWRRTGCAS